MCMMKSKFFAGVAMVSMVVLFGCADHIMRNDLYEEDLDPKKVISVSGVGGVSSVVFPEGGKLENGHVYKLTENVKIYESLLVSAGHDVSLDLNGFVLEVGRDESGLPLHEAAVKVEAGGKLTILDSNPEAKHKYVKGSDGLYGWNDAAGTELIRGGAITGGWDTRGGGIIVQGELTLLGGNVVGNTASSGGGGVYIADGASFVMNSGRIIGNLTGEGYFGGGVFCGMGAKFEMNGGFISNNSAGYGGGVFMDQNSEVTMTDGIICENTAVAGMGGGINALNVRDGDPFVLYPRFLKLLGGVIRDNTANGNGGGVATGKGCVPEYENLIVSGNRVEGGSGGGVYMDAQYGDDIIMRNVSFSDNVCTRAAEGTKESLGGYGGGLWVRTSLYNESTLYMYDCVMRGNVAESGGGGMSVQISSVVMADSLIVEDNVGVKAGGGIIVDTGAIFCMAGGAIRNNQSALVAGFYNYGGLCEIVAGDITGNLASDEVGGIAIANNGSLILGKDTNVSNNTSLGAVGGILVQSVESYAGQVAEKSTLVFNGGAAGNNIGKAATATDLILDLFVYDGVVDLREGGFGRVFGKDHIGVANDKFVSGYFGSHLTNLFGPVFVPANAVWEENPGDNPLFPVGVFPHKVTMPKA